MSRRCECGNPELCAPWERNDGLHGNPMPQLAVFIVCMFLRWGAL